MHPHRNPIVRSSRAMPTRRRLRKRRSVESVGSAPIESARSKNPGSRPDLTTDEARRSRPSARGRAPFELALDGIRVEAAGGEQDVRVEPEIGELGHEPLVALPRPGEGRLDPLLADLPRGCGRLGDEPGDVRALRPRRRPFGDPPPEPRREAGDRARVARRAGGTDAQQDRVAVAIVAELLDRKRVARGLALAPETPARTAEEVSLAGLS